MFPDASPITKHLQDKKRAKYEFVGIIMMMMMMIIIIIIIITHLLSSDKVTVRILLSH